MQNQYTKMANSRFRKKKKEQNLKKDVAAKKIGEAVKDGLSTISLDKEKLL